MKTFDESGNFNHLLDEEARFFNQDLDSSPDYSPLSKLKTPTNNNQFSKFKTLGKLF